MWPHRTLVVFHKIQYVPNINLPKAKFKNLMVSDKKLESIYQKKFFFQINTSPFPQHIWSQKMQELNKVSLCPASNPGFAP